MALSFYNSVWILQILHKIIEIIVMIVTHFSEHNVVEQSVFYKFNDVEFVDVFMHTQNTSKV